MNVISPQLVIILLSLVYIELKSQIIIDDLSISFIKHNLPLTTFSEQETNDTQYRYADGSFSGHPSIAENNTTAGMLNFGSVLEISSYSTINHGPQSRGYYSKFRETLSLGLQRRASRNNLATLVNAVKNYRRNNITYEIFAGGVKCTGGLCENTQPNGEPSRFVSALWLGPSAPQFAGDPNSPNQWIRDLYGLFSQYTSVATLLVPQNGQQDQLFLLTGHVFRQNDRTFHTKLMVRNHSRLQTIVPCNLKHAIPENAPSEVPRDSTPLDIEAVNLGNGAVRALVVGQSFYWVHDAHGSRGRLEIRPVAWNISSCILEQDRTVTHAVDPEVLPTTPPGMANVDSAFGYARRLIIKPDGTPFVVGYIFVRSQGRAYHFAALWTHQNGRWNLRVLPHVRHPNGAFSKFAIATGIAEFRDKLIITGFSSPISTLDGRQGTLWVVDNTNIKGMLFNPNIRGSERANVTWASAVNSNFWVVGREKIPNSNNERHVLLVPTIRALQPVIANGGGGWASLKFYKIRGKQRKRYQRFATHVVPPFSNTTASPQNPEHPIQFNSQNYTDLRRMFLSMIEQVGLFIPDEIKNLYLESQTNSNTGIGENPS
ncbi:MAG: hypothetical protein NZT61_04835 [Deltaproteobacteria bacterium]|nr:hypothetical protein [Deltaproteobacteria bacterium]